MARGTNILVAEHGKNWYHLLKTKMNKFEIYYLDKNLSEASASMARISTNPHLDPFSSDGPPSFPVSDSSFPLPRFQIVFELSRCHELWHVCVYV